MNRYITKKFTKSIVTNSARVIKFAKSKVKLDNYKEITIEKLFSRIIEKIIKTEPFTIKLQHKLMLSK